MLRYGLFGRLCRDACVHLFKVLHYLQKQGGGSIWKSKPGRLPRVLYSSAQSAFFEHFEEFSEHGMNRPGYRGGCLV
jgi:hypothetical protein